MDKFFLSFLNISLSAGWLILAVLVLRLVFRKVPKYIRCILWALVGVRLVLPFEIKSIFSLMPTAKPIPSNIIYSQTPSVDTGISSLDGAVNPIISGSLAPDVTASVNPVQIWLFAGGIIWIIGVIVMALYGVISYGNLRRRTAASIPLRDNMWLCDDISSPFILGIIKPRIFIPSDTDDERLAGIEAHEKAHLARKDHWWKPLGYILLAIHWINPLVWLGYVLLCRDIELACDEKVIGDMSLSQRKDYSAALLSCSIPHRSIAACPLAFGEVGVKERVRSVLSYKKPAVWIITASVVLCIGAAICFLTSPVTAGVDDELESYLSEVILEQERSSRTENNFPCEEHDILAAEEDGDLVTVYMLVMYNEYSCVNGVIRCETSSHIPTAITVEKNAGGYSLVEYWQSEDGTRYVPSIRNKFPWYIEEKAINIHKTSSRHEAGCIAQAEAHFGVEYVDQYAYEAWTTTAVNATETSGYITVPTERPPEQGHIAPELDDIYAMNIGTDVPRLIYGDGNRFILTGSFGLLIYDVAQRGVIYRLPYSRLEKLGDGMYFMEASEDGSEVYISQFEHYSSTAQKTLVLDTEQLYISEFSGEMKPVFSARDAVAEGYLDKMDSATERYLIGDRVVDTENGFWYTRAYTDWLMVNLQLVHRDASGSETVHYIFESLKRPLPPLELLPAANEPMDILTGRTLNELGAVWGEPQNGYSDSFVNTRLIPGTDACLTVTCDPDDRTVTSAQINEQ